MQQIENLTTLPFLFHHLAIMPDVHAGKGMPIGGVLACKDAVVPNAVGVDIGCGMCAVKTNWKVGDIPSDILKNEIINGIRQRIPLGMSHHEEAQDAKYLPQGYDIDKMTVVKARKHSAMHEIGTLVPVVVRAADAQGQLDGRTAPEPPATAMMCLTAIRASSVTCLSSENFLVIPTHLNPPICSVYTDIASGI